MKVTQYPKKEESDFAHNQLYSWIISVKKNKWKEYWQRYNNETWTLSYYE